MADDGSIASQFVSWNPPKHAISYDRREHPSGQGRRTHIVQHTTAPAVIELPAGEPLSNNIVQEIGRAYLVRLEEVLAGHEYQNLDFPDAWREALGLNGSGLVSDDEELFFAWRPVYPAFETKVWDRDADAPAETPPRSVSSYRLVQTLAPNTSEGHQTIILMATECYEASDGQRHAFNSGFGLRIVMHAVDGRDGAETKITLTSTTVHLASSPYATLVEILAVLKEQKAEGTLIPTVSLLFGFLRGDGSAQIANLFQLVNFQENGSDNIPTLRGFRYQFEPASKLNDNRIFIEVTGTGTGRQDAGYIPVTYGFTAKLQFFEERTAIVALDKHPLVTHANVDFNLPGIARVFDQDPTSWRHPNSIDDDQDLGSQEDRKPYSTKLDAFRTFRKIGDAEQVELEFPANNGANEPYFIVRNCPDFVMLDPEDDGPKTVELPVGGWPEPRAEAQSAVAAFYNYRKVYEKLLSWGIDPRYYFRASELCVDVFYRSGMPLGHGKDGETVNAAVALQHNGAALGVLPIGEPPKIQVYLALAELYSRERCTERDKEERLAEPLGMANAERWLMHEFGHVLIAATIHDLVVPELLFVHSVGDAIAAIWSDPFSRLADGRIHNNDLSRKKLRGYTFPWVFTPRRHDRCVSRGWGWNGTFQLPVRRTPEHMRTGYKGYLSEQILSSTLFRLYLILGGNTDDTLMPNERRPDFDTRETASQVVLFLLTRALQCFGNSPAEPEELEEALICADLSLTVPLTLTLRSGETHQWYGGLAHKAIRWAFEAQGLHAPLPDVEHNAPGLAPAVDIFITDGRGTYEETDTDPVIHGEGGYVPVSLDWGDNNLWMMQGDDAVHNRGRKPAQNVQLRFWFGFLQEDLSDPAWDRGDNICWFFSIDYFDMEDVPPGEARAFEGPDRAAIEAKLPADYDPQFALVRLVEVTCGDDRANSDPAAHLPCAIPVVSFPPAQPREVSDLVANDNNLGLQTFFFSNP